MGVVEIMCVASNSVYQGGVRHPQPMSGAEDGGLRVAAEHHALIAGDSGGGLAGACDGEADMVEQASGALVQDVGGYITRIGTYDEIEQGTCLGRGPVVVHKCS